MKYKIIVSDLLKVRLKLVPLSGDKHNIRLLTSASDDFIIPLTANGTGANVGTLQLTVDTTTTMTIDGNGHFYDDSAGTTGENESRTITSGANRTFYIKVTSGSCNLTILGGNLYLTRIDGWETATTNAPYIDGLNLIDFPRTIVYLLLNANSTPGSTFNNTITGDIGDLPPNLTLVQIRGGNSIYGDINNLPSSLTAIILSGYNTITGDIANLKSVLNRFDVTGSNSVYGDIGDLKAGFLYFLNGNFGSQPNITGDIVNLPSTLQILWLRGSNNSITGNINNFPTGITSVWIETASNSLNSYTLGRDWPNNISNFIIKSNASGTGLTSAQVDNLIIDLDNNNSWPYGGAVTITGSYYESRTNNSNSAVLSLQSKGVTVTTNGEVFNWPLKTNGNGSGVSTIQLEVSTTSTMNIDGNGRFYDTVAGTTGENQSRTITSGALRTFYMKVISGSTSGATISILSGNTNITKIYATSAGVNVPITTSGLTLKSLPLNLTEFKIGENEISGNLVDLPSSLVNLYLYGSNTISGNTSSLSSNLKYFDLYGNNTVTGDIADLSVGMIDFRINGANSSFTGDLANLQPTGLTYLLIAGGPNTVSGVLSDLSANTSLTLFWCKGTNTLSGSLNDLPSLLTSIAIHGYNTVNNYTSGRDWPNNMYGLDLICSTAGGGLSSTEIDNLLIDLDSGNTWGTGIVRLTGAYNAARTAASAAAVTSLQGKGVTVTTNV